MSSSKPKNTPATCPKCKQRFEFERVPKMTSIVCPHCDAKIRLKRKKSETPSTTHPPNSPPTSPNANPEPQPGIITGGRRLRSKSSPAPTPAPEPPPPEPIVPQRRYPRPSNATVSQTDTEPTIPAKLPTPAPVASPEFDLPKPEPNSVKPDQPNERGLGIAADSIGTNTDQTQVIRPPEQEVENDLLPPKFLVRDIESDENAVVLPTATGGTQVVDRTEVTVSHGGQTVKLVASTPEELKKIRLIENLVALLIAGIMLAIAVWLVL